MEACPPSTVYRFRKFARRNKVLLATSSTVLGLLLLGLVGTGWQAYRARRAEKAANIERDRADEERVRAQATLRTAIRAVDEMYMEVAEKHLTSEPMAEPLKVQFSEGAVRFYTNLSLTNSSERDLRYEKAKALLRLGRCQHWLGQDTGTEQAL